MKIEWNQINSVGVKEFDEQHKKIIEYINELFLIKESGKKDALSDLFKKLSDYSQEHLIKEEEYFDKFKYPETEKHKEAHKYYLEKIKELEKKFNENEDKDETKEILEFLGKWWINHINGEDAKYMIFFDQKGVY